jgi:hypothetical protein
MQVNAALGGAIAAAVANGAMVGATLDQSVKQLPARHRIALVLRHFVRLQIVRAGLRVAGLAAVVWVLVATVAAG